MSFDQQLNTAAGREGFIAVWEDDSLRDGPGNLDIFARGFFPGGCASEIEEFRVNMVFGGDQRHPDVAMDDAGNFVVVWEDDTDGNGYYEIYMRGFHADGTDRFASAVVNSVTTGPQLRPAIYGAPNGDFVILWEDDSNKDGKFVVMGRAFSANGSSRVADFRVSATSGDNTQPDICVNADGSWTASWTYDAAADGATDVEYRNYKADGTASAVTRANIIQDGPQLQPAIGCTPAGDRVIVWQDDSDEDSYYDIFGRGIIKQ